MSLTHLLQRYDAIGVYVPRMAITLDQAFTGSAELTAMFRAVFGQDAVTLTCTSWERSPGGAFLRLAGTASLLHLEDAPVEFSATDLDGELRVELSITLPSGWTFARSFPEFPGHYREVLDEDAPGESEERFVPLLNGLSLGASRLLFTNGAHHSEAYGVDLLPGLNFAGELFFMGDLFGVTTLTGEDGPVFLSGPVLEYRQTPDPLEFLGLRLQAPLPLPAGDDWPVPVRNARIFIKAPVTEEQVDHTVGILRDPGIYFLADAGIAGRSAELVAKYASGDNPRNLAFYGRMTGFALAGFSSLAQSVGGDDIEEALPEEARPPAGIQLTEFGLGVSTAPLGIGSVMVGVGCDTHWEIVPGALTVDEVGVTVRVSNPFDAKNRALALTLAGQVALGEVKLAAYADYPTYRFGGGLAGDETIPLGNLIEKWFPKAPGLPEMEITELVFDADPTAKTFALACSIEELLSVGVGETEFEVAGLGFAVDHRPGAGTTGAFTAEMTLGGATAILAGELTDTLVLSGSVRDFRLREFWALVTGGEELPDEVPDVTLEVLAVSFSPDTGDFTLLGNTTVAWDRLGGGEAVSTTLQFSFTRRGTGEPGARSSAFTCSISLTGTGPVTVAEGFRLGAFNFLLDYQTGFGWKLAGGIKADIFDATLDLQASYDGTGGKRRFRLQAVAPESETLIGVEAVGRYSFDQLDLVLDVRKDAKATRVFHELRIASTLEIDEVFSLGGFLVLRNTAEGNTALVFQPHADSGTVRIGFPTGEGAGVRVHVVEVGFARESAAAGWAFTGTCEIGITGLPSWLDDVLPSKMFARLVAGKKNARISALYVTDPIPLRLPDVDGKELGTAFFQLTEVGIALKPDLGLVVEAGVGLPAGLNSWLGSQLFRVYQEGNVATMARTRFTISGTGVAMQFVTSPFTSANAVSVGGEAWFDVDLGEYGALQLKMPTFRYDGVTQYFEAGGGCKVTRPLALPMGPLKAFLGACGMGEAAEIFPDAIPVSEIKLVDRNNDLKTDELVSFLRKAGDVPREVVTALKQTGKVLNRFPDGFKQYFNIEMPTHLEFRFGFSPAGRISLGLLAPNEPVRVLFPSVVQSYVPMPGLVGIEVRKVTLGTIASGSLFFGEIDAVIDQFDVPSLAVSLMLPRDEDFPLPTSDQLQRRIILDDVFCVVPASAGVPIPIPVFYDLLAFEYVGVEGIGLGAHVSFPKPPLDGAAAMAFFSTLKAFFGDPKVLLDPKNPPGGLDLAFTFRDEFLAAPEYLGGKVLGTRGKEIRVGTWEHVARMMNFFKTFSVNDLIGSVPLAHRVGSAEHRFAFMRFDADWLLTTPAEFRDGASERLKLSAGDRDDFLAVLPSVATDGARRAGDGEEGLVAFVRGEADLSFVRLEAVFGLAASGSMGFNTGFKLSGGIGDVIELELSGAVMVNAPEVSSGAPELSVGSLSVPDLGLVAVANEIQPTLLTLEAPAGGRALSLNGRDAWVEIPASDSLLLPEYTVEMWVRPAKEQKGTWIQLFGIDSLKSGEQRNCYLELNAPDASLGHRFKDNGGGNAGIAGTPRGSVRWGEWQHVAITNDGRTGRTLIDGVEVASGGVNGSLALLRESVFIGKKSGSARERFFRGEIAEVRIWKRARSAAEIGAEMRETLSGSERDLVSLYRFDTDTGTRAIDLCGRNHGTITNGSFPGTGMLALSGADFNGAGDFAEVPDSASLRLGAYTVEAWFRPRLAGMGDWAGIAGKRGRNHALFIHRDGFVHHRFRDDNGWNGGIADTPRGVVRWERWNHVAITNDGRTARTFVNGVQQAEGTVRGALGTDNTALQIGRTADGADNTFFPGQIAEVRVWSRARSLAEVRAAMHRPVAAGEEGLVSLWRPGEARNGVLRDACGRNHGRIQLAPRAAAVTVEAETLRHDGLVLNGAGDYAFIEKSDRFRTPRYTLEAWIRPDTQPPSTWQCVWGGNGKAPKLYINSNGLVSHRFFGVNETDPVAAAVSGSASGGGKSLVKNTDAGLVRWGEWNHLAITHDGENWRTLVNGVVVGKGKVGKLVTEAVEVNVGRSHEGKNEAFFRGSIDDLRFWSVARTPEQIRATMNLALAGNEAGLVACYDMDHTSGSRLTDRGPNRLHGVVNGARWALAVAPAEPERAALQVLGHAHLDVAGHRALVADLRIVNREFWFNGTMDLFPKDWPIRVYGHVEGMLSPDRFYLSGDTETRLFGLVLARSRLFVSDRQMRLEGRWMGAYTLLEIVWTGNDPRFTGSVYFNAAPTLDFGTVRIAGVKVADNVRIRVELLLDVRVDVSRRGFQADVAAAFRINGVGFSFSFGVDVAPSDVEDLARWVGQRIIDQPARYLAHLFSDAAAWLRSVGEGAIEFASDSVEAIGDALKTGFGVTREALAPLMKNAGYAADKVGTVLARSYGAAAADVTRALHDVGYAAEEVGRFLQSHFNQAAKDAAKLLRDARYAAEQVGRVMDSVYRTGAEKAAEYLRHAGYAASEVGEVMQKTFSKGAEDTARFLKDAGYGAAEVGQVMANGFQQGAEETARFMRNAGYAANEVGQSMASTFNKGAEDTAKIMAKAGYETEQVVGTMTSVFRKSGKDAKKLADDAGNWMKGAGGTVKKEGKKILGSVGIKV